jgi:bidirectional [NiFe] hydrogenase diaphorase subunit
LRSAFRDFIAETIGFAEPFAMVNRGDDPSCDFLIAAICDTLKPMDRVHLSPPNEDKRWRMVIATMRRHGHRSQALIETLHTVQEAFGYLEKTALRYVAAALQVPLSRVYGVATFYHFFNLKPQGEHACVVCLGTACYIQGAAAIVTAIGSRARIRPGETTPDGKFSLLTARCLGSCGLAPAAVFDGEVAGNLTVAQVMERIDSWLKHES